MSPSPKTLSFSVTLSCRFPSIGKQSYTLAGMVPLVGNFHCADPVSICEAVNRISGFCINITKGPCYRRYRALIFKAGSWLCIVSRGDYVVREQKGICGYVAECESFGIEENVFIYSRDGAAAIL